MISPNELYERIRRVYEKPDCRSQDCGKCFFYGRYNPLGGLECGLTAIEYALKIKD